MGTEAAIEKKRFRVCRGEPGCHQITPLKDGNPVIENPPVPPTSSPPTSFPAPLIENLSGLLLSRDKTAHYRLNLVKVVENEYKKGRSYDEILEDFNSGRLLKETFERLGFVSRRTFFRWKSAFNEGDIKSLIPATGRKGVSKVAKEEVETVLKYLLNPSRLNIEEGIFRAKEELKERGIESPSSPDILRRFINKVRRERADLWIYYREGAKAADDKVFPYLERDWTALEVGDVLVGDGHRLNFQVVNPFTGKPCRPVIVFFWDWRSSYILGWELMIEESVQCVTSAFRNAIICLGKKPKCVYLDNGKAFKAKVFTSDINLTDTEVFGMFNRLGIETHFALPYNARSKPIERIFRIFNEQLSRLVPSYVGASIEDKPCWLKPNEKFAQSMQNPQVPTIEEVNNFIVAWVDRYVNTPTHARDGLRPKDIFDQGKGPGVDLSELDSLMMSREIRKVHRNGITWLGLHWYDEALCGLKDFVVIRYSYTDLSKIYVYYKNEFLCIARPVQKVHPMASISEDPKDMEELNCQRAEIRRIKRDVVKVCREGGPKILERLPLKEIIYKIPNIDKEIEKIESEKSHEKFISPFIDEPMDSDSGTVPDESDKVDMAADHGLPFSCPWFKEDWEMYEWFYVNDPKKFNITDLCFIDWHEDGRFFQNLYKYESGQSSLKYLLSKRLGVDFHECEERSDYSLGCDPIIMKKWEEIKDSIIVDPISGLSRPAEGLQIDNEMIAYEFYRGIEKRFPGTLNDKDWEEIRKYELTREWEFHFKEEGIHRLVRVEDER
jgi:putative transposase